MYPKKVPDMQLLESYCKTQSVWKTAKELKMCGQSVHERLVKLSAINKMRVFTDAERNLLRSEYVQYRNDGRLQELADRMGRTRHFICRQASILGLTDIKKRYHKDVIVKDAMGYLAFCGCKLINKNAGKHVHRVVMEKAIGRKLLESEVVHHRDGNKENNRIENLQLMTTSSHMRLHENLHKSRRTAV